MLLEHNPLRVLAPLQRNSPSPAPELHNNNITQWRHAQHPETKTPQAVPQQFRDSLPSFGTPSTTKLRPLPLSNQRLLLLRTKSKAPL